MSEVDPIDELTRLDERDEHAKAVEVALERLAGDPYDLELLDTAAPIFLRAGRADALVEAFLATGDHFRGVESVFVFNFLGNVACAYCELGRGAEGFEALRPYLLLESKSAPRMFLHNAACVAALAEDWPTAVACLRAAFARGEVEQDVLEEDDFAELRGRPEFAALLSELGAGEIERGPDRPEFGLRDAAVLSAQVARRDSRGSE